MLWRKRVRKKRRGNKFFTISIFLGVILTVIVLLGFFVSYRLQAIQFISPVPARTVLSHSWGIEILLRSADISFSSIQASQSSFIVKLENGAEVFLGREKDMSSQVSSLQGILSRLTMEGKTFIALDLRFDKPIIRLK